ncbi:MAG: ferrous iron transport protein B [Saccharofermentanales bacterium]
MKNVFALIGNQNSGKTTLFNQLTGSNQHVGNFPGVTVEKKSGQLKKHKDFEIVDLPGIYSLSPYTSEEVLTRDFLIKDKPDAVINIIDATNIERNLYLTLQVIELGIPMVIALNMMDEVLACGNSINVEKMSDLIGVDIVPVSASKNWGVDDLIKKVIEVAQNGKKPEKYDFCTGEVHRAIHSVAHIIESRAKTARIPVRFAASKIVEGDILIFKELDLSDIEIDIISHITKEMEDSLDIDREAALADMRYQYIEELCLQVVVKLCDTKEQKRTLKLDRWLTHKYLAIPIFLGIMSLIFYLTFGALGSFLSKYFTLFIDFLTNSTDKLLTLLDVNATIHSLIIDGVFAGIGSVLSFLPIILLLFFFLSILEDTGYMARVAFVMDKLLRKIGLSGKSFVPMLIGFGCSVPAIMATRTLASERDRKMTIILIPFMSCSAKLPIYAMFTAAFFPGNQALVMIILYVMGMVMAILASFLLKNTIFRGQSIPFILELPSYRFPSAKSTVIHMWDKAKGFIKRAFTIIFIVTLFIWLLRSFDFKFNSVSQSSESMLAVIGSWIAPVFAPLGFGDWRASTALITGLSAKEAVVSTFAVLTGARDNTSLLIMLKTMFSPLAAFSFLAFTLLYMPCVATFATIRREFDSIGKASLIMLFQTSIAWFVAFAIYQGGLLLGL